MKRVLVTGASGLLGLNFSLLFREKYQIIGVCNRNTLQGLPFEMIQRDFFTQDVDALLEDVQPQIVLHCAAMANIDACEKDPSGAEIINAELPGKIAAAAYRRGIKMVHISTDAVFNGKDSGISGYKETDAVDPINTYARTKLQGERNVLSENADAIVARVNFYGWSISGKRSLAEIFYHNLSEGKPMKGFTDIFFSPLCIINLAQVLDRMIELDANGLYHVFSSQFQSKYEFGVSIAERFGLDAALITPTSWRDAGLTAVRSANLIMNTDKLAALLGTRLPDQHECLESFYQSFSDGLPQRLPQYIMTE